MRRSTKKEFLKAVESGDLASLRTLLANGTDPNFKTSYGESPLVRALHRRHEDVAMLLLDSGADPGAVSRDGASPLFWAARYGYLRIVARLLELGANVHAAREGPVTPLAIAVSNGHVNIVRLLLANGADPERSYLGKHLTHFAHTAEMHDALTGRRS